MSANQPIVTWSGRVHYRNDNTATVYDSWDRGKSRPYYAALCNPNTLGEEPIENSNGDAVARTGVEEGRLIADLPVCKRCAKKVTA